MAAGVCTNSFYGGHTKIYESNTQHCQYRAKMKWMSNINISQFGSRCSEIQGHFCLLDFRNLNYMGVDVFRDSSKVEDEVTKLPNQWWHAIPGLLMCILLNVPLADAVDTLETYACLLKNCSVELAKCIANPSCMANIVCLETCHGQPNEAECEIRCGDLFENKVVVEFNQCAVSRKKCIPRIPDIGEFPIPDSSALVKSFNISDFSGKWYITSGLNPTFDIYDCQFQEFHVESGKLVGNLSWRIRTPDGSFFTRTIVHSFVQDPLQPAILYNHDNEYLNYRDNWYIVSSMIENRDDDYIFVYYRGSNDAWDGYGGAVVYTRRAVLPDTIIPKLEKAASSIGREFSKFISTDNTCGPKPSLVEGERKKTDVRLFQDLTQGFIKLWRDEERKKMEFMEQLTGTEHNHSFEGVKIAKQV